VLAKRRSLFREIFFRVAFAAASIFAVLFYILSKEPGEIVLGQTCPLSGGSSGLGLEMTNGANVYFYYIKENGGINGKKIRLITYDDKYEPNIAKQNAKELIKKDKAVAIFGSIGTPTGQKTLSVAMEYKVPFLTPFTGATFLREPFNRLVINLRAGYEQEIDALVDYLIKTKKVSRIALFYQNDSFGMNGLYAVKKALFKRSLEAVAIGSFNRNTLSVQKAPYEPCAEFIKRARTSFELKNTYFCPISFTGSANLETELSGDMKNIISSQVFPNPVTSQRGIIKLYRELYGKKYEKYTYVSLEGFLSAALVTEALKRAGSLDAADIINAFERLPKHTLDGFEISLSRSDHQALDEVFIVDYSKK
jgi:branched-chain amino acid transport system substrate-binding protein